MADFEISGLEELRADLEAVVLKYPDETNTQMRKFGNRFKKDCNNKMPESYKKGKRPILKSWEVKTEQTKQGFYVATEVQIRNKAPHFHLVENGHEEYDFHGKPTGRFVPGKHFAEKTRIEYEDKFPEEMKDFLDKMLGREKL